MARSKKETASAEIPQGFELQTIGTKMARVVVRLTGTSSLLIHAFSQKAAIQMLGAQTQHMKVKKEPKNPREMFEGGKYYNEAGDECIKTVMVKNAMAEAATFTGRVITKKDVRAAVWIGGEAAPINGVSNMRTDMVRVGGMTKVADIRFRPEYKQWSVDLVIDYNAGILSLERVIGLLQIAGKGVGLGDGRSALGTGRFTVETLDLSLAADVEKACSSPLKGYEFPQYLLDGILEVKQENLAKSIAKKPKKKADDVALDPAAE